MGWTEIINRSNEEFHGRDWPLIKQALLQACLFEYFEICWLATIGAKICSVMTESGRWQSRIHHFLQEELLSSNFQNSWRGRELFFSKMAEQRVKLNGRIEWITGRKNESTEWRRLFSFFSPLPKSEGTPSFAHRLGWRKHPRSLLGGERQESGLPGGHCRDWLQYNRYPRRKQSALLSFCAFFLIPQVTKSGILTNCLLAFLSSLLRLLLVRFFCSFIYAKTDFLSKRKQSGHTFCHILDRLLFCSGLASQRSKEGGDLDRQRAKLPVPRMLGRPVLLMECLRLPHCRRIADRGRCASRRWWKR